MDVTQLVIATFIVGYFVAHLVYQVQPRFRYEWMPAAFIYAGLTLKWLESSKNDVEKARSDK